LAQLNASRSFFPSPGLLKATRLNRKARTPSRDELTGRGSRNLRRNARIFGVERQLDLLPDDYRIAVFVLHQRELGFFRMRASLLACGLGNRWRRRIENGLPFRKGLLVGHEG
jgi:hypothetical protein